MPKPQEPPDDEKIPIQIRLTRRILREMRREEIRLAVSRAAIIRLAWAEYMERHPNKPR